MKEQLGVPAEADLGSRAPLIHVTTVSADWNHWFRANGIEIPASIDSGLRVDTVQMGFEAAIRGLGVVLGRRPLVDDDTAAGRLVPLVRQAIPSGSGYWLVTSQTEFQKPEVKRFRRWLVSELSAGAEDRKSTPSRPRSLIAPAPRRRGKPASRRSAY